MLKVLIWDTVKLSNTGGPSGYLYNIHEHLKSKPSNQIFFLSDIKAALPAPTDLHQRCQLSFTRSVINYICKLIPQMLKSKQPFVLLKKIIDNVFFTHFFVFGQFKEKTTILPKQIDLDEFDFIHFHLMTDLLKFKKTYPNYKGKTILTTHCPGTWTDEKISSEKKWLQYFRKILLSNECKSYKLANFLMFPCKEAREPYEKDSRIKKLFQSFEDKFFYVPTGILKDSHSKHTISREVLGIPKDAFIISFFGRHSTVKGYDILVSVGKKLLSTHKNLYFICAGKGDISPPKHSRWIELGFINNVEDYLPLVDLYILPNRNTYFDLITLELLRAGTTILLSETGGNKTFLKFPQKLREGLFFFDVNDESSLETMANNLIMQKRTPLSTNTMKLSNQQLFKDNFIVEIFVKEYLKQLEHLYL